MKVLIDMNVILDWLMVREPNAANARLIMEHCLFGKVEGYISSHSVSDLFYILRKDFSVEKRKELLRLLCEGMQVVPEDKETIHKVLSCEEWKGLEDGLQMQCAEEVEADYVVTQNLKDFQKSEIKAVDEEGFCEILSHGILRA